MNLPLTIARRYLFAHKSQNIINIISMISAVGVFTATVALVVVLSVFNGLHGFIGSLFSSFDPQLLVAPVSGKVVADADSLLHIARQVDGVAHASAILCDNALLKYGKRQMPARVMGVDSAYSHVTGIDTIMVDGRFCVEATESGGRAVLGFVLADQLGARSSFLTPLVIYAPKRRGQINMAMPENSFVRQYATVAGTFAVKQMEYDANYAIVDISAARRLFGYTASPAASSIGISLKPGADEDAVARRLEQALGDGVSVRNRLRQHESFFKMMQVEKLMAFLILTFILVIAAFNIIGSLSMLIYEKKDSIFILKSMGASRRLTVAVFFIEGCLVSLGGVVLGVVVGVALVLVQQVFGVVGFGSGEAFIIDAYPVRLDIADIGLILLTVTLIGALASWYPVRTIVTRYYRQTAGE